MIEMIIGWTAFVWACFCFIVAFTVEDSVENAILQIAVLFLIVAAIAFKPIEYNYRQSCSHNVAVMSADGKSSVSVCGD